MNKHYAKLIIGPEGLGDPYLLGYTSFTKLILVLAIKGKLSTPDNITKEFLQHKNHYPHDKRTYHSRNAYSFDRDIYIYQTCAICKKLKKGDQGEQMCICDSRTEVGSEGMCFWACDECKPGNSKMLTYDDGKVFDNHYKWYERAIK